MLETTVLQGHGGHFKRLIDLSLTSGLGGVAANHRAQTPSRF